MLGLLSKSVSPTNFLTLLLFVSKAGLLPVALIPTIFSILGLVSESLTTVLLVSHSRLIPASSPTLLASLLQFGSVGGLISAFSPFLASLLVEFVLGLISSSPLLESLALLSRLPQGFLGSNSAIIVSQRG